MKKIILCIMFFPILIFYYAYPSYAFDMSGDSNSIIIFNKNNDNTETSSKLIEYLNLSISKNNYSIHLSGWTSGYLAKKQEEDELEGTSGDILYGTRISKEWGTHTEIGISYLYQMNSSSLFRKDTGMDIYYVLNRNSYLTGQLDYNLERERIISQNYIINYLITPYLTLMEEYKRDSYKYIFPSSTSSVFSFFENEIAEKWKTLMDINSSGDHALTLDYQTLNYIQSKNARYYGGELRYRMLTENTYGVSIHRMDAGKRYNNYNETREFMRIDNEKYLCSLEAMQIFYNKAIYERRQAYEFMATLGYNIKKNILLAG
ncbi:hypothetical protein HY745_01150, partial [Candidatus Desantisbacteria bacterium]|nr:hypothetical protein [Candidatus Desantisbacteria bacterium]